LAVHVGGVAFGEGEAELIVGTVVVAAGGTPYFAPAISRVGKQGSV
jgi:hypothetical protein